MKTISQAIRKEIEAINETSIVETQVKKDYSIVLFVACTIIVLSAIGALLVYNHVSLY